MVRAAILSSLLGSRSYADRLLNVQGGSLIGLWEFQEASGPVVANRANKLTSTAVECLANGGFEVAGGGGADVFSSWFEAAGDGAIADETTIVKTDSHACKITSGAGANTYVYQDLIVKPGQQVSISVWTRGDGTNGGRYVLQNAVSGAILVTFTEWGVTGTDYEQASFNYTPGAGVCALRLRLYGPAANGGICYYDDVSALTITDATAKYPNASITYSQPGPGFAGYPFSVKLLGANSGVILGSGGYSALNDSDVGSAIGWARVSEAAVWTDASTHRYIWHPKDTFDGNSYLAFGRNSGTNNSIFWRRRAGALANSNDHVHTFASPPLGWFCMGFSWNINTPRLKGYLYVPGELAFTKVFDVAGVDMDSMADRTWLSEVTTLGGGGGNIQLWQGWLGPAAQWAGVTLSDVEMKRVMVP